MAYAYEAEELEWLETLPRAECQKCGSKGATRKRVYIPDLSAANPSMAGTSFTLSGIVELKGRLTADDRKTLKGAKAAHPGREIRILFQRDNWMTRKKARRYSDWARQNGFEYAIGREIPDSWLTQQTQQPATSAPKGPRQRKAARPTRRTPSKA